MAEEKVIAGVAIPLVANHAEWQTWWSLKLASVTFALQAIIQFYMTLPHEQQAYLPGWTMQALLGVSMLVTALQQPARVIQQTPKDGTTPPNC